MACESIEAAATAEQVALTPRERPDLEQLAIAMDGEAVADPVRYQRLLSDSLAIWQLAPELAPVAYAPRSGYHDLTLVVAEQTYSEMLAGRYLHWDCLNERYGVRIQVLEPNGPHALLHFVELTFTGVFNLSLVGLDYTALPGIDRAIPSLQVSANRFCAVDLSEGIMRYFVVYGSGDCFSGCTEFVANGFESSELGRVTALGRWDSQSGEPTPEWFNPPDYCW